MTKSSFFLGNNGLIGQEKVREQLTTILSNNRLSHAYLLAGPVGVGKKAVALSFAEAIQGINNLTSFENPYSKKSSWFTHPDIHLFFPLPSDLDQRELLGRRELLLEDPYQSIDFGLRPSINGNETGNKQAFYSIQYYREHIKPCAYLKPNEGKKTIIILSEIEKMRVEMSNAFLKLLEEPNDRVVFIMTTNHIEKLLPTIISRCQLIQTSSLKKHEIENALVSKHQIGQEDASYLARMSGGNYSITLFHELESLKENRNQVIDFLRNAFTNDAIKLVQFANTFSSQHNIQGQINILNMLEVFLRDIMIYQETEDADLLTNIDQEETIKRFCQSQKKAKINEMIEEIEKTRISIRQNCNSRLAILVLANRFYLLMRGKETLIPKEKPWNHAPALF